MNLISIDNPDYYYALCYITAFLVAFILLTIEGIRRKFLILPWWLIMATTFLFFMIGSQLIRWRTEEWQLALQYQKLAEWPGRSVLGGILLFVPALLLSKRILKFRHNVVDTFAFMFPAGLAIQRVGCLLAGCCHGKHTSLPWGIQYNASSPAFHHQQEHGIISSDSLLPLPVHPVQLYDLISCIIILLILSVVKKRIKAPGNLLTVSLFCYGFFRFFLEGLRAQEHETNLFLNTVQIVLLILLPIVVVFFYQKEKKAVKEIRQHTVLCSPKKYFGYCIAIILLFLFVSRWLGVVEIISLNLVLIPVLFLVVWKTYQAVTLPSLRVGTLVLMALCVFTMSQTYPEYGKNNNKLSYWTAGYGFMSGKTNAHAGVSYGTCGNSYAKNDINEFSSQALEVSHVIQRNGNESMVVGLNGFWGKYQHSYFSSSANYTENNSMWGINPYLQYNWELFGIGGGVTMGDFSQTVIENNVDPSHVRQFNIYPSFSIRAGKLQEVFFEYRFANQFPTPFPALTHQLSFGISTGKRGGVFRMGTGSNAGIFFSPSFTLGDNVLIEPFISFGGGLFGNGGTDDRSANMAMISAHFKFNKIETAIK